MKLHQCVLRGPGHTPHVTLTAWKMKGRLQGSALCQLLRAQGQVAPKVTKRTLYHHHCIVAFLPEILSSMLIFFQMFSRRVLELKCGPWDRCQAGTWAYLHANASRNNRFEGTKNVECVSALNALKGDRCTLCF